MVPQNTKPSLLYNWEDLMPLSLNLSYILFSDRGIIKIAALILANITIDQNQYLLALSFSYNNIGRG